MTEAGLAELVVGEGAVGRRRTGVGCNGEEERGIQPIDFFFWHQDLKEGKHNNSVKRVQLFFVLLFVLEQIYLE